MLNGRLLTLPLVMMALAHIEHYCPVSEIFLNDFIQ